jgi:hypothetical protein
MNPTKGGRNLKTAAAMAQLVVLFLLAVAFGVQQAATTDDRDGGPTMSATSAGGASLSDDPYIDRHAEIIARYHGGSLR